MREDFEKWFFAGAASHASERKADGEYKYMPAAQAWKAWKAGAENERVECERICKNQTEGFAHNSVWDEAALCCADHIRMRSNASHHRQQKARRGTSGAFCCPRACDC